jgi:hypothetical protein
MLARTTQTDKLGIAPHTPCIEKNKRQARGNDPIFISFGQEEFKEYSSIDIRILWSSHRHQLLGGSRMYGDAVVEVPLGSSHPHGDGESL